MPDSFKGNGHSRKNRAERPTALVLSLIRTQAASLNFLLDSDSRALGVREADIFSRKYPAAEKKFAIRRFPSPPFYSGRVSLFPGHLRILRVPTMRPMNYFSRDTWNDLIFKESPFYFFFAILHEGIAPTTNVLNIKSIKRIMIYNIIV